jgi:hypothetical protein
MRYTSANDQVRHGAVWSPGPVANSVWVIDDETGEPVAVRIPHGDVSKAHQDNSGYMGEQVLSGELTAAGALPYGGRIIRFRDTADILARRAQENRLKLRYAPKLPEKVWRAAVGDQCEQLELTAA